MEASKPINHFVILWWARGDSDARPTGLSVPQGHLMSLALYRAELRARVVLFYYCCFRRNLNVFRSPQPRNILRSPTTLEHGVHAMFQPLYKGAIVCSEQLAPAFFRSGTSIPERNQRILQNNSCRTRLVSHTPHC